MILLWRKIIIKLQKYLKNFLRGDLGNFDQNRPHNPEDLLSEAYNHEQIGNYAEAIRLLEENAHYYSPEKINLALARNYFEMASKGQDTHVFRACFCALDAIRHHVRDAGITHAIGILEWCITRFSDVHRLSIRDCYKNTKSRADNLLIEPDNCRLSIDDPLNHKGKSVLLAAIREFEQGNQVKSAKLIFEILALDPRYGRDLESLRQENAFHLAQLLSVSAPERLDTVIGSYEFLPPGPYDDQLSTGYFLTSSLGTHHRRASKVRAPNGILITSLPKSASEFLSYTISEAVHVPVSRVSLGDPFFGVIRLEWIRLLLETGGVTHDHFCARPENLSVLQKSGAKKMFVLVRDPRSVAWSAIRMQQAWSPYWRTGLIDALPINPFSDRLHKENESLRLFEKILEATSLASTWISGWLRAEQELSGEIAVQFIRYKELTAEPIRTIANVLGEFGIDNALDKVSLVLEARRQNGKTVSNNFRTGNDDEWRDFFPEIFHVKVFNRISNDVRELLKLSN